MAFQVPVGYSDHTNGVEVTLAAVALGACVIEKHFTLDRVLPGPDHRASLEPEELKDMVTAIRNIEKAMGDGVKKPSPSEIKNILNKTKERNLKRTIDFGNIKIDLNKHLIIKSSKEYKINNAEKTILEEMINSPGKTFSRDEIGKIINLEKERSIDVIITRLRKKIEIDPKNPKYLQTIRGAGYVLWIE